MQAPVTLGVASRLVAPHNRFTLAILAFFAASSSHLQDKIICTQDAGILHVSHTHNKGFTHPSQLQLDVHRARTPAAGGPSLHRPALGFLFLAEVTFVPLVPFLLAVSTRVFELRR